MESVPTIPRRVVTGHDVRGVSIFAADGPVPVVRTAPDGAFFYEIWSTDATPAPIDTEPINTAPDNTAPDNTGPAGRRLTGPGPHDPGWPDPTLGPLAVPPAPGGTKIRINEFPPGVVSPVHRTQSVDYAIVLSGEVVLVLDDAETTLRAGDVVVQRGTNHRWENRSSQPARMAFVLIDGAFTPGLLATLGAGVLGGLLHDPMHAAEEDTADDRQG